jgi:hypothetical protein
MAQERHAHHSGRVGAQRPPSTGISKLRVRNRSTSSQRTIVSAFGFNFDHAFGFYSGLKPVTMMRASPRYELFVDMGDADPGVLSVKKTKVAQAFPAIGHEMRFLFDYGMNGSSGSGWKRQARRSRRSDIRASSRPTARLPSNTRMQTISARTHRPTGSIWRPARE